jgi:iron complex outermembrane receptor protein
LTPDWRHLARATWDVGKASLSLGWRMVGPVKHESRNADLAGNYYDTTDPEAAAANEQLWTVNNSWEIGAAHYFDLAGSYRLKQNYQIMLGVNNILDKEPPLGSGIDNIDYGPGFWGAYDPYGRYAFANLQFTF